MNLGSTEAVKNAVRAGLGISIVLASSVEDEVAAGHLVAVPIKGVNLDKDLFVVHRRGLPGDGFAARFLETIV